MSTDRTFVETLKSEVPNATHGDDTSVWRLSFSQGNTLWLTAKSAKAARRKYEALLRQWRNKHRYDCTVQEYELSRAERPNVPTRITRVKDSHPDPFKQIY